MAKAMTKSIMRMFGFENEDEDDVDYIDSDYTSTTVDDYGYDDADKKNKVVKIHTTAQLKLVIMQPKTFEEAKDIAIHLKSKKPVVMNLESVEREVARRIVDFLSGAVYALDGNIQKVSNGIFLIAPYNIGIMGDFKDELRSKVFPWG